MDAILLAIAGVILVLVGIGVGYWLGRSGIGGGKARVKKAEAELEDYKRSVTEHFGQTAAHFQNIGKQYRELYEHMAEGAQNLCEQDDAGKQLLFAPAADPASATREAAADETAAVGVSPPIDYAASTSSTDAAEVSDAVDEPADESADLVAEGEISNSDAAEGPVSETATESQTDITKDAGERTIH